MYIHLPQVKPPCARSLLPFPSAHLPVYPSLNLTLIFQCLYALDPTPPPLQPPPGLPGQQRNNAPRIFQREIHGKIPHRLATAFVGTVQLDLCESEGGKSVGR